jgi:precorrin-2 dehydrogenase/sirohydrochlorin ferrochelatase
MAGAKRYFPAFIDLDGRLAIVVGGGPQALKRARQFVRHKANVVVIAADPGPELIESQTDSDITLEARPYVRGDLAGAFVVICVDTDDEVQRAVHAEAESLGCLLNVHDVPELCNFLLPSVFRQAQLEVAISTGGVAPPVAKALKKKLVRDVGEEWAEWIELILEIRDRTAAWDDASRNRALAAVTDPAVLDKLGRGRSVRVDTIMEEASSPPAEAEAAEEQDAEKTEG